MYLHCVVDSPYHDVVVVKHIYLQTVSQPQSFQVAGDDIRQRLEFHHVHLELGALGYIETWLRQRNRNLVKAK